MVKEALEQLLAPLVEAIRELDPSDPTARDQLSTKYPIDGPLLREISEQFERGVKDGWLCDRDGGPGVRYSRVKKSQGPDDVSIDAVRMDRPGPGHAHPQGEFDLCLSVSGDPRFDGQPPGWTVYPPGSWHVPTVEGGTMNILYFLPGGAIEFGPKPS